jgi:two-component system, sensor histidine kinase and response regulator
MMDYQIYNILIVDDNPKNVQVLAHLLSDKGFNVEYATNGQEALLWAAKGDFDMILLDIMMPEMDGFEVCKKIREDERLRDIPLIFLTARNDTESITKGFKSGGVDYITKPFNTDELLARVNTHLELKNSREKLKRINRQLEEQVAKRTEELENAKNELEILDKAKTEFFHIISHEIRTPLNGILGFTSLLKTFENPDNIKEYLNFLDSSVARLEKFSLQALDISQLRLKGRNALRLDFFDFVNLFKESTFCFSELLEEKKMFLDYSFSQGDFRIYCDGKYVKVCISNVLENAIHFSPPNKNIKVEFFDHEKTVECKITDNGCGFSGIILEKPFQPFIMGHPHVDKHVGVGLHFSKLIMDAHLGNIRIGNNPDKGAFVILQFPKAKVPSTKH